MMLIFQKKMRTSGGRGYANSATCGQEERGVNNGQKFADVVYGWPLSKVQKLGHLGQKGKLMPK